MNIIVISQYFYPEQFRVSDVCFHLASLGHNVTVLTGLPNYPAGEIFDGYQWDTLKHRDHSHNSQQGSFDPVLNAYVEKIQNVTVLRCNLFPRKIGMKNLIKNYICYALQASKLAYRFAQVSENNFDKIIVFQYSPVTMAMPGILLKWMRRKPLFLYCFDLWPESIVSAGLPNRGLFYQSVLLLSKWIYGRVDRIFISSRNFSIYFGEKLKINRGLSYLPIYAEELFIASQGNSGSLNDDSNYNAHNDEDERINLVFAGNIGAMQSVETIVLAANLLRNQPEIQFHIVGDGSALDKNIQLAKDLSLPNIIFHGRFPLEEMPRFYAMADAFLVTLKKDKFISYTLPGKVQSYLAFGKPILASIDGETATLIHESGCGLCCRAEDPEGLANIILKFVQEKEGRHIYGDHARAYYDKHFTKEAFMKSLLELLY